MTKDYNSFSGSCFGVFAGPFSGATPEYLVQLVFWNYEVNQIFVSSCSDVNEVKFPQSTAKIRKISSCSDLS